MVIFHGKFCFYIFVSHNLRDSYLLVKVRLSNPNRVMWSSFQGKLKAMVDKLIFTLKVAQIVHSVRKIYKGKNRTLENAEETIPIKISD